MKKNLIFFGSANRRGFTAKMVDMLVENLEGETEVINCYREYKKIKPCTDCRHCWQQPECAINDDAQELYKKVEEADNVILASPLYFHCVTGPMKVVFDRFQVYWAGTVRKDKPAKGEYKRNGAVLLCGGSKSFKNQFLAAEIVCNGVLGDLYCDNLGTVELPNTDRIVWEEQVDTHNQIIELAKKLNK